MNIFLIRHGEKESTPGNPNLTELGKQQAKETGDFLRQWQIDSVITSPLLRAQTTADLIAKQLSIEVVDKNAALLERMNWEDGVNFKDFLAEWIKATANPIYQPKYGDSSQQTALRVTSLVESWAATAAAAGKPAAAANIVLVTHGGTIIDFIRYHLGDEVVAALHHNFSFGADYQINNCSITQIVWQAQVHSQSLANPPHQASSQQYAHHQSQSNLKTKPQLKLLNYVQHLATITE